MTTDVAVRKEGGFSLTPTNLKEAMQFADMMSKSDIVPKDYVSKPGNVLVAIQWGMEIGLQPLQAMQNIAVINGRPSIWGDALLAIVRGSGLLESINEKITDSEATCIVKRVGEESVIRTFSLDDAKRAGLAGKSGPWQQYPKRMLQMRARAFALRDVFPDVLRGIHVAEEARDMPAERDMGAVEEVKPDRASATAATLAGGKPREKAAPEVEPPTLEEALAKIEEAATPADMERAAELCTRMSGDDKDKARAAYKAHLQALKAAAEGSGKSGGPSYADIADQINRANSVAEVNVARDLIRSIKDDGQRAELETLAAKRCDEFAIDGGGNGNA